LVLAGEYICHGLPRIIFFGPFIYYSGCSSLGS